MVMGVPGPPGAWRPSQSAHEVWASVSPYSSSETRELGSRPLALGFCCWEAFVFRHPRALRACCEPAGAPEEAAPTSTPRLQRGVLRLGSGGSRVCPRRNPSPALSRCQPPWPGLPPTRVTPPEFERLERWASVRNSGGTPPFQRLKAPGPRWKGAHPLATDPRRQQADALKEHWAGAGGSPRVVFSRPAVGFGDFGPPSGLGRLGGPRLPGAPSPLWGPFDNINISVYFILWCREACDWLGVSSVGRGPEAQRRVLLP